MLSYPFSNETEINALCDRIEMRLWSDDERLSLESIQQELEDGLDIVDTTYEDAVAALEAIEARKRTLGDRYPFEVSDSVAYYRPVDSKGDVYLFCAALATLNHRHITSKARGMTFEMVAMEAAASYFGTSLMFPTGATSHRIVFPSYEALLRKVGDTIYELRDPRVLVPPGGGDGGWDYLVVKPFCDGDYSRIVVGGNCATGSTNWLQKGSETVFDAWFRRYFDGRKPNGPYLEVLSVPFISDDDQRSRKVGPNTILMDRFRIAEHGVYAGPDVRDWLEGVRVVASDLVLR